jgi:hypothetical protein
MTMSDPSDLLAQCRYPDVAEPFLSALKAAVRYILGEWDVSGIIAAGSIIRGTAHATSDWDIYVVHNNPQRQMLQRYFAGVPTQIFLNPPAGIRQYFVSEAAEGVCITAHMFVTGFVVLERDPFIEAAREEARRVMAAGPQINDEQMAMYCYHIADQFENAMDVIETDPASGVMLLGHAIPRMLQFYFMRQHIFIPRDKDLLQRVRDQNPELGRLVEAFYQTSSPAEKFDLAGEIADATIQARGFFECQTALETVATE